MIFFLLATHKMYRAISPAHVNLKCWKKSESRFPSLLVRDHIVNKQGFALYMALGFCSFSFLSDKQLWEEICCLLTQVWLHAEYRNEPRASTLTFMWKSNSFSWENVGNLWTKAPTSLLVVFELMLADVLHLPSRAFRPSAQLGSCPSPAQFLQCVSKSNHTYVNTIWLC